MLPNAFRDFAIVLSTVAAFSGQAFATTVAATGDYTQNSAGLPTSAETVFYTPIWNNSVGVAEHELLHAIAFAANAFPKFAAKIDASRDFWPNDGHTGSRLARLVPPAQKTHIDPAAGTVNGFNQANSLMRPANVGALKAGGQEKQMVDAAFSWSSKNINIVVAFAGAWSMQERQAVNDAVMRVRTLLGSNGTGNSFTWTVSLAPTPAVVSSGAEAMTELPSDELVASLEGNPEVRTAASAALLQRGLDAIDALIEHGAMPMSGLVPRRLDAIYSMLNREAPGGYRTNTFGIHLEPGTDTEALRAMGDRVGFVLADGETCDAEQFPSCYVMVRQGLDLWDVMTRALSTEPAIARVNLNYVEY